MTAPGCIVCRHPVEHEGDRLCPRCALDADVAGAHPARCRCGPCLVTAAAQREAGDRRVWEWREVVAVRGEVGASATSLADYLARRDATTDAADGRGKD